MLLFSVEEAVNESLKKSADTEPVEVVTFWCRQAFFV